MSVNSQVPGVAGPQMPAPVYRVLERTRLRATGRTRPDVNVELILQIKVTFSERVLVTPAALVDAGATIFAAAPRKFFPAGVLEPARTPLSLSTITSGRVEGGKYGAWSDVLVPICSEFGGEWVQCPRVFIYCAEISDELIFGYPFLKAFGLMVCPMAGCLMPRECVTVHPDKLDSDRSRLEIPYVGAIKKTTHTVDQARPRKPAATPVCRTQHYVCASLLFSLPIFLLSLLNSSRLQAPKSAAATQGNGNECSTGFQCGCVCTNACACHRQCSDSGIAPIWHATLLEGHSSMPVIPDGQCCPGSLWRSCFGVWTSPKTFVSPVRGCNSALQKSSTVGSCGSHRVCPSNAACAADRQNYASKEPITGASTPGCHEWILQVSLDEFSQGGGGS